MSITIDACQPCQAFWFDGRESLHLAPASTLRLFRLIGEQVEAAHQQMPARTTCPRCGTALAPIQDMQRNTRFQYRRCPKQHGRFITFFDFLREKNFVKPLSAAQIADLRTHVATVNCSNCGGPIDLATTSACIHCGSPLSMLDMQQAEAVVAQLREADRSHAPIDPALALNRERARREVERSFAQFERNESWVSDVPAAGTVGAGLRALARWLGK
jgi:hypothetical protein